MAVYHVDLYNGDDSADGLSWATAWKTLSKLSAIAISDEVKISKTPDPVSIGQATWTENSDQVIIPSGVTKSIEDCNSAWTAAGANATVAINTTRYEGAYSNYFNVLAAFTTGKVAYKTLPTTLDLSDFQQISFYRRSNKTQWDNVVRHRICLCSDVNGDVIVDEFQIESYQYANKWLPLTIGRTGGGNLGSNINSISYYIDIDIGAENVFLDNIFASKLNGINLTSFISKNGTPQGGTEPYFPIKSIVNNLLVLGGYQNAFETIHLNYWGVSETVDTYIRTAIQIINRTTTASILSPKNAASYDFGYNPSTNLQDGETFIDGVIGLGHGVYSSQNSYKVFWLNLFRFNNGVNYTGHYQQWNLPNVSACANIGLNMIGSARSVIFRFGNLINNYNGGLSTNASGTYHNIGNVWNSLNGYGIKIGGYMREPSNIANIGTVINCKYGIQLSISKFTVENIDFVEGKTTNYATIELLQCNDSVIKYIGAVKNGNGPNIKFSSSFNCKVILDTVISGTAVFQFDYSDNCWGKIINNLNNYLYPYYYNLGVNFIFDSNFSTGDSRVTMGYDNQPALWQINCSGSETIERRLIAATFRVDMVRDVVHDSEPCSWKFFTQNPSMFDENAPFKFSLAKFAVKANLTVTIKVWTLQQYDIYQASRMQLMVKGDIGNSFIEEKSAIYQQTVNPTDWKQVELSFTPTQDEVLELFLLKWIVTATSVTDYIGSISITQP